MTQINAVSVGADDALLLDIEGTVSPVAFVYDVMFPFIRDHLADFLEAHWEEPDVQAAIVLVGKDIGVPQHTSWPEGDALPTRQQTVVQTVRELMDRDAKVTGLKQLQGLIWKDGFDNGQLVAELFPDVMPKLDQFRSVGIPLYIYSSGSIGAQKLFFGHTSEGSLLDWLAGHFDTTSGNKKESRSYERISGEIGLPPQQICFVSDVVAELDAARQAGMRTILRSESATAVSDHAQITTFDDIRLD